MIRSPAERSKVVKVSDQQRNERAERRRLAFEEAAEQKRIADEAFLALQLEENSGNESEENTSDVEPEITAPAAVTTGSNYVATNSPGFLRSLQNMFGGSPKQVVTQVAPVAKHDLTS